MAGLSASAVTGGLTATGLASGAPASPGSGSLLASTTAVTTTAPATSSPPSASGGRRDGPLAPAFDIPAAPPSVVEEGEFSGASAALVAIVGDGIGAGASDGFRSGMDPGPG